MSPLLVMLMFAALQADAEGDAPPPAEAPPPVQAPPPAEPPPPPPAVWSIGAGISTVLLRVGGTGGSLSYPARDVPNASLSVERRLRGQTWLLLGLTGSVLNDSSRPETTPPSMTMVSSVRAEQVVMLALGLRQSLLSEHAPVDVSLVAIASFGYQRVAETITVIRASPIGPPDTMTQSNVNNRGVAGLGAGVAVERRLIEGLALRFSLGILQASYSAGRSVMPLGFGVSTGPQNVSGFSFGLSLQPGIELRLYF